MTLQQIARALGGEVCGNQVRAPGPGHSPKDRSLSIKLDASAPDGFLVHSFADDEPIRCKDYVREKLGLPPWNRNASGTLKGKTIVATYDYTDEAGELLFQVVRYTPKGFRQRRPDGNGGWIWSLGETSRVLYRLPDVVEAVALERTIFVAEGEKAVDVLVGLGVPATGSLGGAGKWRDQYSQHLAGADVVILPDNDEAGEQHLRAVAELLAGVASRVRVLSACPSFRPRVTPMIGSRPVALPKSSISLLRAMLLNVRTVMICLLTAPAVPLSSPGAPLKFSLSRSSGSGSVGSRGASTPALRVSPALERASYLSRLQQQSRRVINGPAMRVVRRLEASSS